MTQIQIPKPLQKLSHQFQAEGWPLYAVGGMIRNQLLGYPISDIDICGPQKPEAVLAFAKKHHYHTVPKAVDFGSLEIHLPTDNDDILITEYTTFRKDTYGQSGHHRPKGVHFSESLQEDAQRRDFSVNALYYDLQSHELIDPCHGLDDLSNHILRTSSNDPSIILRDDGLRILRLIRFACELGFDIDPLSAEATREYAPLLQDIPPERIWQELQKILLSDVRYNAPSPDGLPAHSRGLKLLDHFETFPYILPELEEGRFLEQHTQYHAFNVMEHNFYSCACSYPLLSVRLAALLHDIAKPRVWNRTGRMLYHDVEGAEVAQNMLERLRAPKALIERVTQLIRIHMFDLDGTARKNTLRKHFARMGISLTEEFILLREADFLGSGKQKLPIPTAERFKNILATMIEQNAPFSPNELHISGDEIIQLLHLKPGKIIGEIKDMLWMRCACYPLENNRKRLYILAVQAYKQLQNQTKLSMLSSLEE